MAFRFGVAADARIIGVNPHAVRSVAERLTGAVDADVIVDDARLKHFPHKNSRAAVARDDVAHQRVDAADGLLYSSYSDLNRSTREI